MPDFPNFELSAAPFVLRNWCTMLEDFPGRDLLACDLRHIATLIDKQGALNQQGQALDYHGQQISALDNRLRTVERRLINMRATLDG